MLEEQPINEIADITKWEGRFTEDKQEVANMDKDDFINLLVESRIIQASYDDKTTVCCELATERGSLLVYGTIIGILGKQDSTYHEHLTYQIEDYRRLSGKGKLHYVFDTGSSGIMARARFSGKKGSFEPSP